MVKIREFINENQRLYYHGSNDELPVGFVLKPRSTEYEAAWGDTDFYRILEIYRPEHMLSHKDAIFMCDNPDDVDNAGGELFILWFSKCYFSSNRINDFFTPFRFT